MSEDIVKQYPFDAKLERTQAGYWPVAHAYGDTEDEVVAAVPRMVSKLITECERLGIRVAAAVRTGDSDTEEALLKKALVKGIEK